MTKELNKLLKQKRVFKTLSIFIDNNGDITDEGLARILALEGIQSSSSTVGRDLTVNLRQVFLEENNKTSETNKTLETNNFNIDGFTEEQASILAFVAKKRKDNKYKGQVKGGKQSVFNNDILKDDSSSKFNGSKKRRG